MQVRDKFVNSTAIFETVFGIKKTRLGEKLLLEHNGFLSYYSKEEYEVIDDRESLFWISHITKDVEELIFPEWFETYFYENLSNDAPRESHLLRSYEILFTREFSSKFLVTAKVVEIQWCQCPICEDVFENESFFGRIYCPKCYREINNPFENHDMLYNSPEIITLKQMSEHKNCYFYEKTKQYYQSPPK